MVATSSQAERRPAALAVPNLSVASAALWLTATVLIAALAYYFIGYDQGAWS